MEDLIHTYAADPWSEDPVPIDLVSALNSYISEVEAEHSLAVQKETEAV